MKTKRFAMLIALCLLVSHVSAQPYSIRANRGLNLRAAPSLTADIADTVPSGSILQVIGHSGEWLQIDSNGREVWLADWVNFSRVDSSEPTEAQQPTTPVDNCCGIDRQCSSDQEWTDGYWAFQNGQCPAPAQPQPVMPAQPGASAPATGGNCCDSIWECRYEEERVQGYYAFQINQCAGLPDYSAITLTGPVPRIEGSSRFVQHITAALKLMKSLAPAWYNYVITGMDLIVEEHGQGRCRATANYHERRVAVGSCFIDFSSRFTGVIEHDLSGTAGMLGHEACHIHRQEEGFVYNHSTSGHEEEMCKKLGTGASVLIDSALATGLDPRRGTTYFDKDVTLSLLRQYCSAGYRADLFCPTLQRLESTWRNVPYSVFPPGAPE